jgi:SpoVK/Ycf46/Vps4 family AAA+-type ATPase
LIHTDSRLIELAATIQETWDDIALEPDIKAALQDVAVQSRKSNRAYGVLKKGRIGGALLYGPPGTGKTHLARVLARESRRTMIFATPAEITNRYVGDTEKAIRALFNLGRLLAPAMIFIDEADSLFRQRQAIDTSWERAQTNQFLTEMDGLKKYGNDAAPFMLLASNFPQHLDHAALRRVPQRLYIRLPSAEIRTRILEIQLREEELHAEVDLVELGRLSEGYSGSDIQTLCVQAALACEVEHDKDDDYGDEASDDVKRVLRNVHFAKAVQRTAPTVSTTALSYIEPFAKEFDPIAWNKIQHDSKKNELSNRSENGNSTLRRFG